MTVTCTNTYRYKLHMHVGAISSYAFKPELITVLVLRPEIGIIKEIRLKEEHILPCPKNKW